MAPPTIIITGSSRGIGAATARLAGQRGWNVGVNYASNQAAAESVVAQIRADGGRAISVQADNSHRAEVERLFDQVTQELGPVTALVNNAGVPGQISRVEQLGEETLRRTLDVNVVGAFLCAQAFIRRSSTRHGGKGGAIVNVSSMASKSGSPGELVHYAAAKAALETFNYGLAAEVAQEGIRVNAVSLGLFATEIHATAGDADRLQRYAARMPMGRPGEPMEAAQAILWLLSEEASYITGATLPVAGGR